MNTVTTKLLSACVSALLAAGAAHARDGGEAPAAWERAWPNTDFSQHTVDFGSIRSGGPPKDGIPSIDEPEFVSYETADGWLGPREPVIGLALKGEAKAYPLQVLTWHEIANDRIGGIPVAVTFCPLCNAAIVFDARVGDRTLTFGTTGKLRKSDLVMYDRQTQSWWQQFTGEAIVGEMTGTELRKIPAPIVAYEDFKAGFPGGKVLSRDTGYNRPYGKNPYVGYDKVGSEPFMARSTDDRLPSMMRVLGVTVGDTVRVYPFSALEAQPVINDTVGGRAVAVLSRPKGVRSALDAQQIRQGREIPAAAAYDPTVDGEALTFERRDGAIVDTRTGSTWNVLGQAVAGPLKGKRLAQIDGGVHFAFAWLSFKPDTTIFRADAQ